MAFLDNSVALIITANLVIQIVALFLLALGYVLKRKVQFRRHGLVMSAALILHLIMAVYVMVPSFVLAIIKEYIIPDPFSEVSVIGLIHGVLGSIALSFGLWIVVSWHFRMNIQSCIARKKYMKKTLAIWITSLIFGIILYSILIGPVLSG